ncbi:MAG: RDD family protein [Chloroflexi bacterium]|nr:RDD family protein [Chloroflexota bacterium]MDA1147412.1 RDD family protein [Chloroflexota bacterium]
MPHASLRRRSVSGGIDLFVTILIVVALGLITGSTDPIFDPSPGTTAAETNEAYFDFFWMAVFFFAVYGAVAETTVRLTIGKAMTGTRTVSRTGDQVARDRALMRNVAKLASIYPFALGLVWAVVDKRNRAWHDLMTGTYVADARQPTSSKRP